MRTEHDQFGTKEIPDDALYGINAVRAKENFPASIPFHDAWYRAVGSVKRAVYETYSVFAQKIRNKYDAGALPFPLIAPEVMDALTASAREIEAGEHRDAFIVSAITGGAGTSQHMNVNEILANRALQILGHSPGTYSVVHPNDHANVFQSTNDVMPSALKLAAMRELQLLEKAINSLRGEMEAREKETRDVLRIAFTEGQEAAPTTYGKLFGAYAEALSRDWWRVSKCFERVKVVNLGGSAIGTGITVPRYMVLEIAPSLARITGMPITRAEHLTDATMNLDSIVEVHATLKANAVNLEKIAGDIRLLSADIGPRELSIPPLQHGSSIMPGKVNPVALEFAISVAHIVYANDATIASLCGQGVLDLNANLPAIGHSLLQSITLLTAANTTLASKCIAGVTVNKARAEERVRKSPSVATALVPYIGYERASAVSKRMREGMTIDEAVVDEDISPELLAEIISPASLIRAGFSVRDIFNGKEHDNGTNE